MNADTIDIHVNSALRSLEVAETTDYIGEPVSQLEHALQCAYFAEQSGHDEEVILASLFHDIGHFSSTTQQFKMADLGIVNHEWIGAKLAYDMGFSKKVALLIGHHVDAKRYLAGRKKSYYDRLSIASKQTMTFQGGPMTDAQMNQFEQHPYFKEILQVRINDEKAKELGLNVPDLNYYRPRIKKHIEKNIFLKHNQTNECKLINFIDDEWVKELKIFLNAN